MPTSQPPATSQPKPHRKQRLAAALKANIKRRKEQAAKREAVENRDPNSPVAPVQPNMLSTDTSGS